MQVLIFITALLLSQNFEVTSFKHRTQQSLNRRTHLNAGPVEFLSGLFSKKSTLSKADRLEKVEKLTNTLLSVTKNISNGIKASSAVRTEIDEVVKDLELLNEEKKITISPAMTGNWKLLYTTNSGSSAGKLGPFIGRVDQDIDMNSGGYVNYVRLGPVVKGALTATWDNLSPQVWKVKFLEISITVFGIPVQKKSLSGSEGIWRMTYLDDKLRILYAQGKDPKVENIYILAKDTF